MKVVVTHMLDSSQTDYMRLDQPLIIDLRYLPYFLKDTLAIYLHKDGRFSHICIDQLKWDGIKEFELQMNDRERKWNLRPLGHTTYNDKVINDNH